MKMQDFINSQIQVIQSMSKLTPIKKQLGEDNLMLLDCKTIYTKKKRARGGL